MIDLPTELIDLIFEFRDGNKKDNFDKVMSELKNRVKITWHYYSWFGVGIPPEENDDEFCWMEKRDGTYEHIYFRGVQEVERKLNNKIFDTILDHYIEKYEYNLDDATYKRWYKQYRRNFIYC